MSPGAVKRPVHVEIDSIGNDSHNATMSKKFYAL